MSTSFDLFIRHKDVIPEHLRKYINRARLFLFNVYPTEAFDSMDMDEVEDLTSNFCLPFPVVAIEDKTSCVILWDLEKNAVGIDCPRGMMEIADTEKYLEENAFKLSSQDVERGMTELDIQKSKENLKWAAQNRGGFPVFFRSGRGILKWFPDEIKWGTRSEIDTCKYLYKDGNDFDFISRFKPEDPEFQAVERDYSRGMITAYEELLAMSNKRKFIMEIKPKETPKKDKYLYAHERPKYVVVKPSEARKAMKMPKEKETQKRKVNERRAHIRKEHEKTLRSAVFTKMQGKTVQVKRAYIPAIWNGDHTAEVGKYKYRVVLDLPKGIIDSCVKES